MQRGELLYAAELGEVEWMRKLLHDVSNLNPSDIDDADDNGRTTLMAAARGMGHDGEAYSKIISMLLAAYSQTMANLQAVLLMRDDRHNWTVFMHSAKCGDIDNLNLILDVYDDQFGSLSILRDLTHWSSVNHKVKHLITERVFSGNPADISKFGRTSHGTRTPSQGLAVSTQASTKLSTQRATSSNLSGKRKDSRIVSSHQMIQKKAKAATRISISKPNKTESKTNSTANSFSSTESSSRHTTMHDTIKANSNETSAKTHIMIDCEEEEQEEDLIYDDETVNLEGSSNPTATQFLNNAADADADADADANTERNNFLRTENTRLRQENEKLIVLRPEIARLRQENEKLKNAMSALLK